MRANERRPNRKMVFVSKWDHRKPLRGEKLKKMRQMWYRGIAYAATLEDHGMKKPLDILAI